MISLHHSFVIDHIEDKKIPTRNGDTFEFTEVTMCTKGKYPTWLQARLESPEMKMQLIAGEEYAMDISVGSWKSDDGRVFPRFTIRSIVAVNPREVMDVSHETPSYDDSDIPF
jgi:hypothetical protein